MDNIKTAIGEVFNEVADAIMTGNFGSKVKVGLTILGSEHGVEELVKGAEMAARKYNDFEIILIGSKVETSLEIVEVSSEEEMHREMDRLLETGKLDAAVTMHYNFPIGVSTVGRITTPSKGKELIVATTTGTSSTHRVEGMIKNALNGIAAAKAIGISNPTVGVLNVDGARQVERALKELKEKGYGIDFSESMRADGGSIMRGNDMLTASPDVMVMDTLTGNIMVKLFSAYTTGGDYESAGYGYGPGVGDGYDKIICILSRASGAPVICEALRYAASCAQGNLTKLAKDEYSKAKKAGLDDILKELKADIGKEKAEEIKMPDKKIVTETIEGIDILELDDAVMVLAKESIYSESGMGCTGPIILTAKEDFDAAVEVLLSNKFISQRPTSSDC